MEEVRPLSFNPFHMYARADHGILAQLAFDASSGASGPGNKILKRIETRLDTTAWRSNRTSLFERQAMKRSQRFPTNLAR